MQPRAYTVNVDTVNVDTVNTIMFATSQEDVLFPIMTVDRVGTENMMGDDRYHLPHVYGRPQSILPFNDEPLFARQRGSERGGDGIGRSPLCLDISLLPFVRPTPNRFLNSEGNAPQDSLTGLPQREVGVMPGESLDPDVDKTIQGRLEPGDELNRTRGSRFKDDYIVQSDATVQVQIAMDSDEIDSYVQILDGRSQQVIGFDDDGGEGLNAQLTFTAQAGVNYIIRATSYDVFEMGDYTLRVNTIPLPPNSQVSSFSMVAGYGLVNAADAVAQALSLSPSMSMTSIAESISEPEDSDTSWSNALINAPDVWNAGFVGQDIVVAVVDTGVDYTHLDLDDNIWRNPGEVAGNGIDDDGNGYVDDVIGWDFVNNDNEPMDRNGHGTHVAGTIAAENDGVGVTGVAYGATIMPIQVLGQDGLGMSRAIAAGIRYAADNGARVINLSLGSDRYDPSIESAVSYAADQGALVVSAAGNSALSRPGYPARFATNWGVSVGAVDKFRQLAGFSNRAGLDSQLFHVVAPGASIESTRPGNAYGILSGTSMAAPHVSGVAALMLSANPTLTDDHIREVLINTTA